MACIYFLVLQVSNKAGHLTIMLYDQLVACNRHVCPFFTSNKSLVQLFLAQLFCSLRVLFLPYKFLEKSKAFIRAAYLQL